VGVGWFFTERQPQGGKEVGTKEWKGSRHLFIRVIYTVTRGGVRREEKEAAEASPFKSEREQIGGGEALREIADRAGSGGKDQ